MSSNFKNGPTDGILCINGLPEDKCGPFTNHCEKVTWQDARAFRWSSVFCSGNKNESETCLLRSKRMHTTFPYIFVCVAPDNHVLSMVAEI